MDHPIPVRTTAPGVRKPKDGFFLKIQADISLPIFSYGFYFINCVMRLKAAFFLFVLLFSLGSAWAIQASKSMKDCCAKMKSNKECHKPSSHEKDGCNTDYCNPFLTCSTSAIVLTKSQKISTPVKAIKQDYVLYDIKAISNFLSKHWQPPRN